MQGKDLGSGLKEERRTERGAEDADTGENPGRGKPETKKLKTRGKSRGQIDDDEGTHQNSV